MAGNELADTLDSVALNMADGVEYWDVSKIDAVALSMAEAPGQPNRLLGMLNDFCD